MVSTKYFQLTRLCLALLISFNHVSVLSITSETEKISVTDFKFYRKIYYKKNQLLIYKNTAIQNIFFLSDKNQQDYTKRGSQVLLNIKIDSAQSNYKIGYLNNKLQFSLKQKVTYFENISTSQCAKNLEENFLKLSSRSILRSIQSVNVAGLADDTCNDEQKQKLSLYLSDMLTTENAWLSKCYSNESVKKLIDTDPNYLNYTGSVYSKYLNLVQKINDGEKPIQISCKISTPGKLGSFDETSKPEKISFDWANLSKQAGSDSKLPDSIKATLGHELFHYGEQMQTPENASVSTCINESYAKMFTDICTDTKISRLLEVNNQKSTLTIPTSEQIVAACSKESKQTKSIVSSFDNTIASASQSGAALSAGVVGSGQLPIANASAQQTQQTNAAIPKELGKTISQSDFTQPSDSDFATLASNTKAGTTEGKAYTVSANSSFGQTVQKTMNAFANSGNTLTNKLNTAVAAATNTAQATTTTFTSTGSNKTTTSTTGSTYIPTSTSTTSKNTQTNDASNTTARMPANAEDNSGNYTGATGKTSLGTSGQPSEMGGGTSTGGSNNSFSTGSGNLGNTNSGKGGAAQAPNAGGSSGGGGGSGGASSVGGSSAAPALNQKSAEQKRAEDSEVVKTITSLKTFNTVSGGQYQEIKKHYNNPQFQNLLKTFDMRIMVRNPAGQYVGIGVDSKKAKKVFNDDGQVLKTVEEKK